MSRSDLLQRLRSIIWDEAGNCVRPEDRQAVYDWIAGQLAGDDSVSKEKGGGFTKHDNGKARLDLVPVEFIEGISYILDFGADKYGAWNWAKGCEYGRLYAAALRHLFSFNCGHDDDAESGMSHLLHAATNIMFLYVMQHWGIGNDDRWARPKQI